MGLVREIIINRYLVLGINRERKKERDNEIGG